MCMWEIRDYERVGVHQRAWRKVRRQNECIKLWITAVCVLPHSSAAAAAAHALWINSSEFLRGHTGNLTAFNNLDAVCESESRSKRRKTTPDGRLCGGTNRREGWGPSYRQRNEPLSSLRFKDVSWESPTPAVSFLLLSFVSRFPPTAEGSDANVDCELIYTRTEIMQGNTCNMFVWPRGFLFQRSNIHELEQWQEQNNIRRKT